MARTSKSANAGVHTATGIEFQKHCALYLFLEQYEDLKGKSYFICIEHHDDFLFCFKNPENLIYLIDTYQSKKSSTQWSMSKEFFDFLKKIAETGIALRNDEIKKSADYTHNLHFITNYDIALQAGKPPVYCLINAANQKVKYTELDQKIRDEIKEKIKLLLVSPYEPLKELDNVTLAFIDMAKASEKQKELLLGKFVNVFGNKVADPKAGLEILLLLFREIETRLNQGNVIKLLDTSKRVESEKLNDAIKLITTKTKAYDLWRSEKKAIAKLLTIPIAEQTQFELEFDNSLDLFKDLTQAEHQKILNFVEANRTLLAQHTEEPDCINALHEKFNQAHRSQLTGLQVKSAIFAAYMEVKGQGI